MSQVASNLLNEEIWKKSSSSSYSQALVTENKGGEKIENPTTKTSQKEDQKLEKTSLVIIVERTDT